MLQTIIWIADQFRLSSFGGGDSFATFSEFGVHYLQKAIAFIIPGMGSDLLTRTVKFKILYQSFPSYDCILDE